MPVAATMFATQNPPAIQHADFPATKSLPPFTSASLTLSDGSSLTFMLPHGSRIHLTTPATPVCEEDPQS